MNFTGLLGAAEEVAGCCDSAGFVKIWGSGGNKEREPAGAG